MALVNRSFSVNVTPGAMPPIVHVSEYDVGRAYTVSILDEQGNTFTMPVLVLLWRPQVFRRQMSQISPSTAVKG